MKKSYLLAGAIVFIVLSYLGSLLFSYSFYVVIRFISAGLSILAIIFSGALSSGDRVRANYSTNQQKTKTNILTGWNILVFAIPFYLVLLYIEFFIF